MAATSVTDKESKEATVKLLIAPDSRVAAILKVASENAKKNKELRQHLMFECCVRCPLNRFAVIPEFEDWWMSNVYTYLEKEASYMTAEEFVVVALDLAIWCLNGEILSHGDTDTENLELAVKAITADRRRAHEDWQDYSDYVEF